MKMTPSASRSCIQLSSVPVIFLTGDAQEKQVREAIDLSVNAYLLKPVTLDTLKSKLVALLVKKK